jgi:multiple sugar transport system ATP-binding protein
MNMFQAEVHGGEAVIGGATLPLSRAQLAALGGPKLTVGIRPDGLLPTPAASAQIIGTVDLVEDLGSDAYAYCSVRSVQPDSDVITPVVVRVDAKVVPPRGSQLGLRFNNEDAHLFRSDTGDRLPT